ncbi:MAG: hypothetical protein FWE70_02025 [Oscillospiraceae bacterium]|nr:hypothetical protein [Oscillospiraceae bacterium]
MGGFSAVIVVDGREDGMRSARPGVAHELCGRPILRWVSEAVRDAGAGWVTYAVVPGPATGDWPDPGLWASEVAGLIAGMADVWGPAPGSGDAGGADAAGADGPRVRTVICGPDALGASGGGGRGVGGADAYAGAAAAAGPWPEAGGGPAVRVHGDMALLRPETIAGAADAAGPWPEAGGGPAGWAMASGAESLRARDRVSLHAAARAMNRRILLGHMRGGVTILDMRGTYVHAGVTIGRDTVIHPGTSLEGRTSIGVGAVIGPDAKITDTSVGDGAHVRSSTVVGGRLGERCAVGPYAYVRPGSVIGAQARIGDFVEVKNSTVGDGTSVAHLSYIGDARLGSHVNIGCGVVTVNFDGKAKHAVEVGDGSFIGCNANLVAPVRVGEGAYVAAGSTIVNEVPADALAIARARQVIKEKRVSAKGMLRDRQIR